MRITQSQSGKHTISNLTETELVMLHQALQNKGYDEQKLADKIEQHLIDCQDEEQIQEEYGYGVDQYVRYMLYPKEVIALTDKVIVSEENTTEDLLKFIEDKHKGTADYCRKNYTSRDEILEYLRGNAKNWYEEYTGTDKGNTVEKPETKFSAKLEKDALDRTQIVIKGNHNAGGYQQINILLEEIGVADIDNLIKQLMIVKEGL